jgi:hypothetical protein
MAYDRHDRGDDRQRWRDSSNPGRRDERGFFERAGDEISSWFGDDPEPRRRDDNHHDRDRDRNDNRGLFARGGSSDRDYNRSGTSGGMQDSRDRWERGRRDDREPGRDYHPMAGDYGRHQSDGLWARDDYRSTSRAGTMDKSDRSRHEADPHYRSWRDRHMSELDRDYDDYRREHQSKFESDFGSWRERRQQKRGMLGQISEHMEVVGNDDQHVGKVDRVAGDRIILTKSDPDSGGVHHSLSCSDIDRVEGDRVLLDCSADQARTNWRDESRSRALFEREDQGEMGPRMLDRSFEGTYR